ncbi:MAG: universal stress protein A [Paraglaciecola sp.]|jgi:universal stress protein A
MQDYQKILVALDINTTYEPILQRALHMAKKPEVLNLIHSSLPHVYFEPYGAAFGGDFVSDIRQQAETQLKQVAEKYGIPLNQVHAPTGSPVDEIHRLAEQIKAELIIIGTHGQSGLKLLLGSTANGVLHGVKCDVLAIKV